MLKIAALASLVASATAFAPSQESSRSSTAVNAAIDDLKVIAEKSNPVLKFYDPLQLSSGTIWGNSVDDSVAFLRHAEIKHGRVAMAAFVGYCLQSNNVHFPWNTFPVDGLSPPEQWDALPNGAKYQIIGFIGFLEFFSEASGAHYMRGGTPGKFPDFSSDDKLVPHPVPLNLFDPFGLSKNKSAEAKEKGLISELNNGRLAMIGIFGFVSEQSVEGSVPALKGLVSHYDGNFMAPF